MPRVRTEVHLYGNRKLPTWLDALPLPQKLVEHRSARLFDNAIPALTSAALAPEDSSTSGSDEEVSVRARAGFTYVPWGQWKWPLMLSTPERAVLELLDELPSADSFHQVDMLIAGLAALSPRRLQHLLEGCKSVKVKRLFFYFADRHAHAWLSRIDRKEIDLGSGKRALVPGGRLDSTYNITVPEELDAVQ